MLRGSVAEEPPGGDELRISPGLKILVFVKGDCVPPLCSLWTRNFSAWASVFLSVRWGGEVSLEPAVLGLWSLILLRAPAC